MKDVYIVSALRTPGCKRKKGGFAQTRPESLVSHILNEAVNTIGLDKAEVDDIMVGCAFPEAEQGLNIGRIAAQMAGFPDSVPGATINRFCASGLESIAISAMRIMSGWADVTMAAGIESMTTVPMGGNVPRPHPDFAKEKPEIYISMGITAENVAKRYKVSREIQDEFSFHSHKKAVHAQENGYFTEIVPTPSTQFTERQDGSFKKEIIIRDKDDGVRADTSLEGLKILRPVFSALGTVTAGNSSQTTDGAAAIVLMSGDALKKYNVKPIAKFKCYTVAGCKPDEMGIGPSYAIPKLLNLAGIKQEEVGLYEINEAFASQAIYSLQKLNLFDTAYWSSESDKRIINVCGGAIALGHPLGCTGTKLAATMLANMQRMDKKYGVESMCIGGGMGAAALFELC